MLKFMKPTSALALVLVAASAALAQGPTSSPAGGSPKLFVESFTHDFGEVKAGVPLRYTFKVRNEGTADLLIQNVQPG